MPFFVLQLVGERAAQLGDAVVRDVVRLPRRSGVGDRRQNVRRDREARITGLEANDARALRLRPKQRFTDLDDFPERDSVQWMGCDGRCGGFGHALL